MTVGHANYYSGFSLNVIIISLKQAQPSNVETNLHNKGFEGLESVQYNAIFVINPPSQFYVTSFYTSGELLQFDESPGHVITTLTTFEFVIENYNEFSRMIRILNKATTINDSESKTSQIACSQT